MNRPLCFSVAIAAALSVGLQASADTIFSDSFDRTTGNADTGAPPVESSWGANDNALGGSSVQTYTMNTRGGGAQNTTDGSVAVFRAGASQVDLDLGPLAPVGYTVAFDFQRATGGGFIAMGIGLDPTLIPATGGFNGNSFLFDSGPASGTVDGAVLFQQDNDSAGNGRVQLFNAGDAVESIGDAFTSNEAVHSAVVSVIAPSGYGAGATGILAVSIDGASPLSTGITFDGENSGYLSFYSNQVGSTIDNLVVTAIPEPTTVGLGLIAATGFLAASRRRVG